MHPGGIAPGRARSGPLPDITDHIVQPVPVGRKAADRSGSAVGIQRLVPHGKVALPGIRLFDTARRPFVASDELRAIAAAARREFPFRLIFAFFDLLAFGPEIVAAHIISARGNVTFSNVVAKLKERVAYGKPSNDTTHINFYVIVWNITRFALACKGRCFCSLEYFCHSF